MKEKVTKEQLIKQNAEFKAANESWLVSDRTIRENFAREFGWFKRGIYGSSEPNLETPPWSKIYVHIGKILANQDFADNHTQLHQIEYRLAELEKKNQTETDEI